MSEPGAPAPSPAAEGAPPKLDEARRWTGFGLDLAARSGVGRVERVFVDADSGEPAWLIAGLGRRGKRKVAIPVRDCAAAAGRVWTAHEREALRTAPTVDPTRPLLREHELTICAHYGTSERVGRAAEVAGRSRGAVTSQPAP